MDVGKEKTMYFNINWNDTEFNQTKFGDLPIDQKFNTSIRIVGFQSVPLKSSIEMTNHKITIDCTQKYLVTYSWQCDDDSSIEASLVCNGYADCPHGEDEDSILCKGSNTTPKSGVNSFYFGVDYTNLSHFHSLV